MALRFWVKKEKMGRFIMDWKFVLTILIREIPQNMTGLQLALFYESFFDGKLYRIGMMSHRGKYAPAIGVLFLLNSEKNVPAVIISNNISKEKQLSEGLKLMTRALMLARNKN